jgi:hypothetical protein
MAYEHERDEWRSAVRAMTDTERDRAINEPREALGVFGDRTDTEPELPFPDSDTDD